MPVKLDISTSQLECVIEHPIAITSVLQDHPIATISVLLLLPESGGRMLLTPVLCGYLNKFLPLGHLNIPITASLVCWSSARQVALTDWTRSRDASRTVSTLGPVIPSPVQVEAAHFPS